MPSRQETLFNFLQSSHKRKQRDEGDVDDKTTDVDRKEEEMPSTSKQRKKKSYKLDIEDIFTNTREAELRIKHYLFPNFNMCQLPIEDFSELQNLPNCKVSLPHPVHVADKHCESIDPCLRRPIAREIYTTRLLHARTAYLNANKKNKKLRAAQKDEQHHNSLFEFAERLEMNPDPFFNGSYDFYYTGGNLCMLPDSNFVVHASGQNLQELNISRFSKKKDMTTVPLQRIHCETLPQSGDILEVMPFVTNREDRPNCFVTRQQNCISLFAYRGEGKLKAITQYNNKNTPFISFAQSAVDRNKFVLTNMKQHVRLFDLNSSKTALSKLYQVSEADKEPQWNAVRPWRENTYLYANTKEMYLMDMRTGPNEWKKTKCGFGNTEMFCENIANIVPSEFKKQIYVGTTHKLYCLDTRCWGVDFEGPATLCCWHHQLEYPPLLLETFRHFSSEFVALSSLIGDDIRICELTRAGRIIPETPKKKKKKLDEPKIIQKYHYKSPSLPYQPPTLHEAYESARFNGNCLRPYSNLQQRLDCCTTGLAFYAHPEGEYEQTLLLTSNSNGDVFAHQFSQRESQEDEPRTSALTDSVIAKYDETISQITQPDLNFTQVNDLKAMSKVFRCAILNSVKGEFDALPTDDKDSSDADDKKDPLLTIKRRKLGRWQKSMQALHNYKDVLVPNILSVWDIDVIAENNVNIAELEKKYRIKPDPETMVKGWLDNMNSEAPMTSIAEDINTFVSTNINLNASLLDEFLNNDFSESLLELPQSTQLLDESGPLFDTTIMQDQPNNSTQTVVPDKNISANADITAKRSNKKKRTTYVKGF